MNALVELNLALLLFLPWYALLGWLFWRIAAQGSTRARRGLAFVVLLVALAAAAGAGVWAYGYADASAGAIWKQVLACVVGYAAFLGILVPAMLVLRGSRRIRASIAPAPQVTRAELPPDRGA